ncbi:MAG TPA: hypothetical protein VGU63_14535 [Candidatus Acidoferrales bacterium]|nr:hypothetical protein [Candidatus Acidoferrales bacterium]
MTYRCKTGDAIQFVVSFLGAISLVAGLCIVPAASAQDRDRDRDRDRMTRIDPGEVIPVRTNRTIDSDRADGQVYFGRVDRNVRGDNGRLAIPRGSRVELMVRVERDNDLIIDLESVTVDGERYAIRATPNRQEAGRDYSVVGAIVGAIQGDQGREVRIPRDSVVTFRIERPLYMGVADRGVDRDGRHYHDWYHYPGNPGAR